MKNTIKTILLTIFGVLFFQTFPALSFCAAYLYVAYLSDKYVFSLCFTTNYEGNIEETDSFFERFMASMFWPVTIFAAYTVYFETLDKKYNLPRLRNPFYWPNKD